MGTRELEALAIVWATDKFRRYLGGRLFHVYADNLSLTRLMKCKSGRLRRWPMGLQALMPKILRVSGVLNPANWSSRAEVDMCIEAVDQWLAVFPVAEGAGAVG